MNNAPQGPEPKRRAFLEPPPPQPFLKTREGRFIAVFAVLFVLSTVLVIYQYQKTQARIEKAAAERALAEKRAPAPAVPLDERLAQKRAELATIYDGAFADSRNGASILDETPGYSKLIGMLAAMTPEETAAKATTYLDYKGFLANPDLYRGQFVRVPGLIGDFRATKLDTPVGAITDVWRGAVALGDVSDACVFDFIGQPPSDIEVRSTPVEVDGLLYRTVTYESRTHEKQTAPYLLVRSIRPVNTVPVDGVGTKVWVILGGIGVIAAYLLARSVLRSQRREGPTSTRLRTLRRERGRALGQP